MTFFRSYTYEKRGINTHCTHSQNLNDSRVFTTILLYLPYIFLKKKKKKKKKNI